MRSLPAIALSLALAGCGPLVYKIDVQQGNYVTQESVAQLKKGMTKAQVRQILGTPLLTDVFHNNRWDYFFSQEKRGRPETRTRLSVFFEDDKLASVSGDVRPAPAAPAAAPAGATPPAAASPPAAK